jgi:hypothetical protein
MPVNLFSLRHLALPGAIALCLLFLLACPAIAGGEEPILEALKGATADWEEAAEFTGIRQDGPWALAAYCSTDRQKRQRHGTMLLQKKDGTWALEGFGGEHPTRDLLRLYGVPRQSWEKLLTRPVLYKYGPLLTVLHKKYGETYYFTGFKTSGLWAFGDWSLKEKDEVEAEGYVIMRQKKSGWAVVELSGGATNRDYLITLGVPEKDARILLPR